MSLILPISTFPVTRFPYSSLVGADLRVIDLFGGSGDNLMGFEAHVGRWCFTRECNSFDHKTYLANLPNSAHSLEGDITKVYGNDIPDHDVLLAGFPCK